jgi:predicted flap endonuclease-1-like 5' DNA nuclease
MQDGDDDTTIGAGGWALVVLAATVSFAVLHFVLAYHLFPALAFAAAIALIVLLILYRLAQAVNRYDDAEASRQVRKIVPATSVEGGVRVSGIEGAQASPVVAVPVRPEMRSDAGMTPLRPSAVVTPLAKLEPAPILPPQPVVPAAPAAPPAAAKAPAPAAKPKVEATPKAEAAPKPKAEAKPKVQGKPKAEFRSKADLEDDASSALKAVPLFEQKPKAAAKPKPKAEVKPQAEVKLKVEAKPKAAAKPTAAAKPKEPKPKPAGLVRLTAPRGGKADDLKQIDGVGPALEKLVNSLGFYHFDQIAAWNAADVALVDAELKSFKGRVTRDKWVVQAKILAKGGSVEEAAAAAAKA